MSGEPLAEIRMFRPNWLHVVIECLNASIYGVAAWEKSFLQNPRDATDKKMSRRVFGDNLP